MRVLVVTQYFWPESFRINDLVSDLVGRGHEVTVVTGKPNYPSGKVFPEYKQQKYNFGQYKGSTVYRVPMVSRGQTNVQLVLNYISFVIGASISAPWKLRGRDYDVIFVFETSPVTVGLPAILLGRLKRAPVVFWVLDLWPDTLIALDIIQSRRILKWVGYLVSFIYNRCTLVLGQSKGFLESIKKYCSDEKKIRYFPNWAEEVFRQYPVSFAPEVSPFEGGFTVVFAGNLGEAQDLPAVIKAAYRLKNRATIRWLIIGDGRMANWLRSEIRRLGLQDTVILLGKFPIERMPSFFSHADALLVSLQKKPVFSITIPGKVQSYMLSGIPIIGMLDGEGADVITEAGAGLICAAGDSSCLAETVQKMSELTQAQRNKFGENGRSFAERNFSRNLIISQLEKMFEEAISSYTEFHDVNEFHNKKRSS